MTAVVEQQAWDFELAPEPLYYPRMVTPENGGKCRDCHRPIKGRYSRCTGGVSELGWFALCDICSELKRNLA